MKYEIEYIQTETKMIDGKLVTVNKKLDPPKPNVIYQYGPIRNDRLTSSIQGKMKLKT